MAITVAFLCFLLLLFVGITSANKPKMAYIWRYPEWKEIHCNKATMTVVITAGVPTCQCKQPGYVLNLRNWFDTSVARCEYRGNRAKTSWTTQTTTRPSSSTDHDIISSATVPIHCTKSRMRVRRDKDGKEICLCQDGTPATWTGDMFVCKDKHLTKNISVDNDIKRKHDADNVQHDNEMDKGEEDERKLEGKEEQQLEDENEQEQEESQQDEQENEKDVGEDSGSISSENMMGILFSGLLLLLVVIVL